MLQLFTSHYQAEELKDFLHTSVKEILKLFGLIMIRKELKHVAK
jgi:hypothetical protein